VPTLHERFGLDGSVISAVDLVRGIGVLAGLEVINVPGATGFLDTNYLGKAEYGLESLKHKDFLFLHVEATDEAGHMGAADKKVQALEDFDQKVVGTILDGLRVHPEWRVLLMPDHATPVAIKTHSADPVPFAIMSSEDFARGNQKPVQYNEPCAKSTGIIVPQAWRIMERFIRGEAIAA
jgi:2,3-bisphosphoglycerate-independent phosphoglycerate mutase